MKAEKGAARVATHAQKEARVNARRHSTKRGVAGGGGGDGEGAADAVVVGVAEVGLGGVSPASTPPSATFLR